MIFISTTSPKVPRRNERSRAQAGSHRTSWQRFSKPPNSTIQTKKLGAEGFEPSKAYANGFTARPLWPTRAHSLFVQCCSLNDSRSCAIPPAVIASLAGKSQPVISDKAATSQLRFAVTKTYARPARQPRAHRPIAARILHDRLDEATSAIVVMGGFPEDYATIVDGDGVS